MGCNRYMALFGLVFFFLVSQFVPIERNNPPATSPPAVHHDLDLTLKRSCFDCHSHETVWPWYSWIAPFSWLISHDVTEGREHLNFSVWGDYFIGRRTKLRKEIREAVDEGEMPPWQYIPAHPEARLSERGKRVILDWTGTY